MITKIRSMLTADRLAWISCAAATTITAGTIAFMAASSPAEDTDIVSVETDTIVTEEPAQTTRTVSRDIEFFSEEELAAMTAAVTEAVTETEEETEEESEAAQEDEPIQTKAEEAEDEEPEQTEAEAEEEAEETEAETEEEETKALIPAAAPETEEKNDNSNEVRSYSSLASGDEEESTLSSALDLEFEDTQAEKEEEEEEYVPSDNGFVDPYFLMNSKGKTKAKSSVKPEAKEESVQTEPATRSIFRRDGIDPEEVRHISRLDIPQWLTLDESGKPKDYEKILTGKACAYTADPGALMSTGKAVFQGYVAVDPNIIPYGSQLYIVAEDGEVYGYAIAADTGGSVRRGVIIVDLFMDEYDDCIQWGNKPVNVYVLKSE